MCEHRLSIATITSSRYITICEHKMIQVHWDNLSFFWQLKDFRDFAALIKRQLHQQRTPTPSIVLCVNQVVVGWPTADFYRFADMVMIGLFNLESALTQLTRQYVTTTKVPKSNRFSLN